MQGEAYQLTFTAPLPEFYEKHIPDPKARANYYSNDLNQWLDDVDESMSERSHDERLDYTQNNDPKSEGFNDVKGGLSIFRGKVKSSGQRALGTETHKRPSKRTKPNKAKSNCSYLRKQEKAKATNISATATNKATEAAVELKKKE